MDLVISILYYTLHAINEKKKKIISQSKRKREMFLRME